MEPVQDSLSPRQTVFPQANVTDTARIFRTTGNVTGTERLRNDSAKQVDAIRDSEKLVVDGSDQKSDPRVPTHTANQISATHTTNGISTQKLLINPTIQVVVGPITLLVTANVEGVRESSSPRQTVLPLANVTDAARICARIYRTTGKVIRTERDSATPRDAFPSKTRSRLSFQSPIF